MTQQMDIAVSALEKLADMDHDAFAKLSGRLTVENNMQIWPTLLDLPCGPEALDRNLVKTATGERVPEEPTGKTEASLQSLVQLTEPSSPEHGVTRRLRERHQVPKRKRRKDAQPLSQKK